MFRTNDADMLGVPGMFGAGQAQWHQVSRVLRTHWYHVTVQATQEGTAREIVLMVDSEAQLQKLLIAQSEDVGISDLQVVTPAHMNGTAAWRMETATQVYIGEDEDECLVCVLEVETGAVHHNSHRPGFNSDSLTNQRLIFLSSMIRSAA
ncbi:hypothetical protein AL532_27265 [Pseudomonas monteilii]|uniref:Uncharacterized protein n=1 Tax=Pseudomonas kurunegalensis TaxID=485880 RepID=A0ACC5UPK7_9PSED|nr:MULTISPECIES: hypothetical protein [Pseudomonas]AVH39738.1 hypothetical protein AL532_27265 [Pseudomonas monteilii]MBV4516184.1 hypothetical protein [Pseudomonas kurunegalensis]